MEPSAEVGVMRVMLLVLVVLGSSSAAPTNGGPLSVGDLRHVIVTDGAAHVKLHTALEVAETTASGLGLVVAKRVPHSDTVLVRVHPSSLIAAPTAQRLVQRVARRLASDANSEHLPADRIFQNTMLRDVAKRVVANPPLLPALHVPRRTAEVCFAKHAKTLFATGADELDAAIAAAAGKEEIAASTVRLAWTLVRTRGLEGPTNITRPNDVSTFLAPVLDYANTHPSGTGSNAKLEFQRSQAAWWRQRYGRRSAAAVEEDPIAAAADSATTDNQATGDDEAAGDATIPERPTSLDVLLTSTASIRKGAEVFLEYGNLRHPLDFIDTYGFDATTTATTGGQQDDRVEADGSLSHRWQRLVPLQLGFPPSRSKAGPDHFDQAGCRDPAVMAFNASTGKPSASVLTCAALAHFASLNREEGSAAMRLYQSGGMTRDERSRVMALAWRIIAEHANRTIREEYTTDASEATCLLAVLSGLAQAEADRTSGYQGDGPWQMPLRTKETVLAVRAASDFMRNAFEALLRYATQKVEKHRADEAAAAGQREEPASSPISEPVNPVSADL
jgi:hypothetical protein